jgi:surface antigen
VNFVVKTSVAAVVGFVTIGGTTIGTNGEGSLAYSALSCAPRDHVYTITGPITRHETWSALATQFSLTQGAFIRQNRQMSSKAFYANQTICVLNATQQHSQVSTKAAKVPEVAAHTSVHPAHPTRTRARAVPAPRSTTKDSTIGAQSVHAMPVVVSESDTSQAGLTQRASMAPVLETNAMAPAKAIGYANPYTYPQCTWWADQRYYQRHGVFVPWTKDAMAWQWTTRAADFGWHISSRPKIGSILVLQPGVQGAGVYGHVAIVEQVQGNNRVIASSTNWGADPYTVTSSQFLIGFGVTFVSR